MTEISLTPSEAKKVANYINNHQDEYITLTETLGIGIGYTLEISTEESASTVDITDYDSF